ncbi:unnamed protein product [Pieris brassicae]|uniref:Retrovirus-related Pol polyprotein from transposon TNT 1-94 n=1 Tax=Pieris brassicae TaxID=7116 RepID=A0A9P0SPR8_PIEBR|nr:unnamed protein product [Pieris brassicae]
MVVKIHPELLRIMILYSLPPNFDSFRTAIESKGVLPSANNLKIKIIEEYEEGIEASEPQTSEKIYKNKNNKKKNSFRRNLLVKEETQ